MKLSDLSTEPLWVDVPPAFQGLMWRRNFQNHTHSANVLVHLEDDPDSPQVLRITVHGAPGIQYGKSTLHISPQSLYTGAGTPPGQPGAPKPEPQEYWLNQQQAYSLRLSAQRIWQ